MTNEITLLKALKDGAKINPNFQPQNNKQAYLAYLCGLDIALPEPRTEEEVLLYKLCIDGISGEAVILDSELTEQSATIGEIEEMLDAKLENLPIVKVNRLNQLLTRAITEITAEDMQGVTSLSNNAFATLGNIVSVTLPETLKSIGSYAFGGCTSLKSIVIPNSVTSIGMEAFYGCASMESVTIPTNIKTLGSNVFYGCTSLKRVKVLAITPPTIQSNTFKNIPSECIFEVSASAYEAYKAANYWSTFNIVASEEF